jgi:Mlc titration factor MtfA (ptsG expression regulator)
MSWLASWLPSWLRGWRTTEGDARAVEAAELRHKVARVAATRVPLYGRLSPPLQERLLDLATRFLARIEFIGRGGLVVDHEMRALVAVQACALILGHSDERGYRRVATVVLHPSAFGESTEVIGPDGGRYTLHNWAAGRAWDLGIVELDWSSVLRSLARPRDGFNVVYHEFAHALDGADGQMGGTPPLPSWARERAWAATMSAAFARLNADLEAGRWAALGPYAATSQTELFAVATEAFFERPDELQRWDAELYELLRDYYNQDPRTYTAAGRGE